jgi:RHS repeat-associated protein
LNLYLSYNTSNLFIYEGHRTEKSILCDYRYSFQGMEKDDEISGNDNSLNYKYRMHNPRIGRFFATDPLEKVYPFNSPYAFSENIVINAVEYEGLEKQISIYEVSNSQAGIISKVAEPLIEKHYYQAGLLNHPELIGANVGAISDYGNGINVIGVGVTSKGNEYTVSYPVAQGLGTTADEFHGWFDADEETADKYTNCFGEVTGTGGYLSEVQFEKILNDDYLSISEPKVGAVGYLKGQHAVEIVGQNEDGEFLYNSNWLAEEGLYNVTFDKVKTQLEDHGLYAGRILRNTITGETMVPTEDIGISSPIPDGWELENVSFTEEDFEWYE